MHGGNSPVLPEQIGLHDFITVTYSAQVKNLAGTELPLQVEIN